MNIRFLAVALCFILSGFAALLYQTAWIRQFAVVFGTSHLAVATVLAAYMAGLAAGAYLISKVSHLISRPIFTYGLLEAGIAVSALMVPFALEGIRYLQVLSIGGQDLPPSGSGFDQAIFYSLVAFLVLMLPTAFMGATLPLLTRYVVKSESEIGPRVGWLYAVNTIGAVLGSILAGFWLVSAFGLYGTLYVGVFVNLLVFLISAGIEKTFDSNDGAPNRKMIQRFELDSRARWVLLVICVAGANSFFLEVQWTRLLNHVFGGTLAAFATMLATFLTGIAIGGAIGGLLAKTKEQAAQSIVVVFVLIAISSLGTYQFLDLLVPEQQTLFGNVLFAASAMLPSTIFIGITFPLAVRLVAAGHDDAAYATARSYSWNTLGAIAGSLSAGFVLIPMLGFSLSAKLAGLVSLALALVCALVVSRPKPMQAASVGLLLLLVLIFYDAPRPTQLFHALADDRDRASSEIHYGVGKSATILVQDVEGTYQMRSDGLPESTIYRRGAPPSKHSQYWLTALPSIARPSSSDMLMIGMGGGVALEAVPPHVNAIDVVELEEEVIRANESISQLRNVDPLIDPRLRFVLNDARSALSLTDKKYDIIVSQPSHPWTAGASHLYTVEFLALARSRLSEDGVFLQWINAQYIGENLLRSLAATVDDVFQHVRVYQPLPNVLLFLASDTSINLERRVIETGEPFKTYSQHYRRIGIGAVEDLIAAFTLDDAGVAAVASGAVPNSDDLNQLATNSRYKGDGFTAETLHELLREEDVLAGGLNRWIDEWAGAVDFSYVATQLVLTRFERRAFELARHHPDEALRFAMDGIGFNSFGQTSNATRSFIRAFELDPTIESAAFSLVRPYMSVVGTSDSYERVEKAFSHLPRSARTVITAWNKGRAGDWAGIRRMDDSLALIEPTDQWFPIGMKLRVDWRLAAAQGPDGEIYGEEALMLLDNTLAFYWNFDLYVQRAAASFLTNKVDEFVESIWWAAQLVESKVKLSNKGSYSFSDRELEVLLGRLAGLERELTRSAALERNARAVAVRKYLSELAERLERVNSGV